MAQRGKAAIVNSRRWLLITEAAINLLTKPWAAEYGPKGVRQKRKCTIAVSPTESLAVVDEVLRVDVVNGHNAPTTHVRCSDLGPLTEIDGMGDAGWSFCFHWPDSNYCLSTKLLKISLAHPMRIR